IQNVSSAHLAQSIEKLAGIIEHDARTAALVNLFPNQVSNAGIAFGEDRRIVIIAAAGVPHHEIQIADQLIGSKVVPSSRNEWLLHMQGHGKTRTDPVQAKIGLMKVDRVAATRGFFDLRFGAAQIRKAIDHLGKTRQVHLGFLHEGEMLPREAKSYQY